MNIEETDAQETKTAGARFVFEEDASISGCYKQNHIDPVIRWVPVRLLTRLLQAPSYGRARPPEQNKLIAPPIGRCFGKENMLTWRDARVGTSVACAD